MIFSYAKQELQKKTKTEEAIETETDDVKTKAYARNYLLLLLFFSKLFLILLLL